MDTKNKSHFVQMVPNSFVDVFSPGIESIIEVVKDGPCTKIKICGLPKVKQIVYG